jgi:soluble lytic murein transglycosylase-like protein
MSLYDIHESGQDDSQPLAPRQEPAKATPFKRSSFDAVFDAAAQEYGVDADVLRAMAYAESRFNPDAVSPKGAVDVMQFMPATAKQMGINPKDPVESIFGGAAYLAQILEQHGGDYEKAVAGYNWGPSR